MSHPAPSPGQFAFWIPGSCFLRVFGFFGLCCVSGCLVLRGHPISMTSAEVEVEAALVRVKLEVLLEDLVLFHQLKPSGEARYSVEDLIQASERHRTFILEKLALFDGTGQRLSGAIDPGASLEIGDGFVAQEALMEERVV